MPSQKAVDQILQILSAGKLEPFIRHIRFPRYKNLASDFRIDFTFPITALVGPNGTNKSSILVALQGAPVNRSPSQYWYSTKMDPIEESGDVPNSLIYGYQQTDGTIAEVIKVRITDPQDPDLWETSRPIRRFGMEPVAQVKGQKPKTRQDPIKKSVVYMTWFTRCRDFGEISRLRNRPSSREARAGFARFAQLSPSVVWSMSSEQAHRGGALRPR
jgi:hypothetical protein